MGLSAGEIRAIRLAGQDARNGDTRGTKPQGTITSGRGDENVPGFFCCPGSYYSASVFQMLARHLFSNARKTSERLSKNRRVPLRRWPRVVTFATFFRYWEELDHWNAACTSLPRLWTVGVPLQNPKRFALSLAEASVSISVADALAGLSAASDAVVQKVEGGLRRES